MLTRSHHPPDVTPTLPPISSLTTPYAHKVPSQHASNSTYYPYACICPQDETIMPPPNLCPHHSLRFHTLASSSPPLTILTLLRCPQDIPLMPPSTLLMPPPTCLILSAAYHPYASVLAP
ncbi:hypothetical protein O181_030813 [Austropuccinia psidii MF-1]|uniref:Uncharacterized protein n=1 Tax=Austropuccinia psidii MF-1 TaxID=1389203 RepID=A0A9Q3CYD9_9BASI|nr:hypothetical protein [Austropuccinia psidii MF-1]